MLTITFPNCRRQGVVDSADEVLAGPLRLQAPENPELAAKQRATRSLPSKHKLDPSHQHPVSI